MEDPAPAGCGGGRALADPDPGGVPSRNAIARCRNVSPLGLDALASCVRCQAYRIAALAIGEEPPPHFPGVLQCGHRMDGMDLCCPTCAEHILSVEEAMGGGDPAREIVGGLGGPLRPDPGLYLRVKPEAYLRIATDEFVRKLTTEGSSAALPLVDAIQAVQMVDMFFSRDRVLGLADGDLSWFRRAWIYHHAGHLDNPDPFWRYRVLTSVASALGVAPADSRGVPGAFPAAGASPALACPHRQSELGPFRAA